MIHHVSINWILRLLIFICLVIALGLACKLRAGGWDVDVISLDIAACVVGIVLSCILPIRGYDGNLGAAIDWLMFDMVSLALLITASAMSTRLIRYCDITCLGYCSILKAAVAFLFIAWALILLLVVCDLYCVACERAILENTVVCDDLEKNQSTSASSQYESTNKSKISTGTSSNNVIVGPPPPPRPSPPIPPVAHSTSSCTPSNSHTTGSQTGTNSTRTFTQRSTDNSTTTPRSILINHSTSSNNNGTSGPSFTSKTTSNGGTITCTSGSQENCSCSTNSVPVTTDASGYTTETHCPHCPIHQPVFSPAILSPAAGFNSASSGAFIFNPFTNQQAVQEPQPTQPAQYQYQYQYQYPCHPQQQQQQQQQQHYDYQSPNGILVRYCSPGSAPATGAYTGNGAGVFTGTGTDASPDMNYNFNTGYTTNPFGDTYHQQYNTPNELNTHDNVTPEDHYRLVDSEAGHTYNEADTHNSTSGTQVNSVRNVIYCSTCDSEVDKCSCINTTNESMSKDHTHEPHSSSSSSTTKSLPRSLQTSSNYEPLHSDSEMMDHSVNTPEINDMSLDDVQSHIELTDESGPNNSKGTDSKETDSEDPELATEDKSAEEVKEFPSLPADYFHINESEEESNQSKTESNKSLTCLCTDFESGNTSSSSCSRTSPFKTSPSGTSPSPSPSGTCSCGDTSSCSATSRTITDKSNDPNDMTSITNDSNTSTETIKLNRNDPGNNCGSNSGNGTSTSACSMNTSVNSKCTKSEDSSCDCTNTGSQRTNTSSECKSLQDFDMGSISNSKSSQGNSHSECEMSSSCDCTTSENNCSTDQSTEQEHCSEHRSEQEHYSGSDCSNEFHFDSHSKCSNNHENESTNDAISVKTMESRCNDPNCGTNADHTSERCSCPEKYHTYLCRMKRRYCSRCIRKIIACPTKKLLGYRE